MGQAARTGQYIFLWFCRLYMHCQRNVLGVNHRKACQSALIGLLLHVVCASAAHGAFIEQLSVSTRAMSMGNAVSACPPGPMAIHYNPAGLSLLEDRVFSAGLGWPLKLEPTSRFSRNPDFDGFMGRKDDPLAGTEGTSSGGKMYLPVADRTVNGLLIPSVGMSFREPGSDWTLGFGIYVPYGVGFRHEGEDNPLRYGGNAIYQQRVVYAAPSLAYRVTETLSLGFTLTFGQTAQGAQLYLRAPNQMVAFTDVMGEMTADLDFLTGTGESGVMPLFGGGLPTYGSLGKLSLDVRDDWTTSYNIGVHWQPRRWLAFGGVYQSASRSKMRGRYHIQYAEQWQNFTNWWGDNPLAPITLPMAAVLGIPYASVPGQSGTCHVEWTHPQRVQLGVMLRPLLFLGWPFENWRFTVDYHWNNTSVVRKERFVMDQDLQILEVARFLGYPGEANELTLKRKWKDVDHFSFGTEIQVHDRLVLRAGYEPRPTAIPKETYDLTLPIQSWDIYSLGAGVSVGSRLTIDAAFSYLKGRRFKIPNDTSSLMNSTELSGIIYNPYAGLDYEQDTEAYIVFVSATWSF